MKFTIYSFAQKKGNFLKNMRIPSRLHGHIRYEGKEMRIIVAGFRFVTISLPFPYFVSFVSTNYRLLPSFSKVKLLQNLQEKSSRLKKNYKRESILQEASQGRSETDKRKKYCVKISFAIAMVAKILFLCLLITINPSRVSKVYLFESFHISFYSFVPEKTSLRRHTKRNGKYYSHP